MSPKVKKEIELEIAHVLFVDIVAYSKLSVNEQHALIEELNAIVRSSEQFRKAETASRLLKIATGDGMALVFYKSPEEPAQCAFEISRALKDNQRLQVRMGIHSGPISGVVDVNERTNVAGAGINLAQRVMDCGDAGHILLSHHVAEDLAEYERWRPFLHDIGTFEVKHGARVSVTNLYSDEVGNPNLPSKLQAVQKHHAHVRWAAVAIALLVVAALAAGLLSFLRKGPARSLATAVEKSIAVLPFENLSEEKANAFFTEGVQDEILTHLARVADLKVINRTSVMQYKSGAPRNLREIGQQLGVAHVVEGSVQRAANKVRVIAQLIDARNDAHLWAQTYDRDLADVFAIQSEIANAIADQLQAKLSPAEKAAIEQPPTENLKAYDLYTEAKHLLMVWIGSKDSKESITRAIALLERATREDPKFALAYCLAVTAHINMYFYGVERTPTQLTAAKQALDAAIQLAPELGETHLAVAYYNHFVLHDFDTARRELELALRTIPNNADAILELSYIDRRQGRWEECLAGMRRANVLDPRNIEVIRAIADTLLVTRRYREEVEFMTRQITLVPESASLGYMKLAECNLAAGDLDEAGKALQSMPADYDPNGFGSLYRYHAALFARDAARAQEVVAHSAPGKLPESPASQFSPSPSWFRGEIALAQHDAAAAKAAFLDARRDFVAIYGDQPTDPFQLAALARIDAMVGRKAEAISEAKRAVELRPVSKDAIAGPWVAKCLAAVCSWTGERNAALEQLEQLARTPGTGDTSYGDLKFNPWWDDLRGDPRFEQIVASLAPKDAASPK